VFLAALNDHQKQAFLTLANAIIHADKRLTPQEEAMLASMRCEMSFPADTPVPATDMEAAIAAFDRRPSRIAAMLELTGLCLADNDVAPEEENLLARIGNAFGLSDDELLGQRDWVLRQLALSQEARIMMMERI